MKTRGALLVFLGALFFTMSQSSLHALPTDNFYTVERGPIGPLLTRNGSRAIVETIAAISWQEAKDHYPLCAWYLEEMPQDELYWVATTAYPIEGLTEPTPVDGGRYALIVHESWLMFAMHYFPQLNKNYVETEKRYVYKHISQL